jgi:hypothetical protein
VTKEFPKLSAAPLLAVENEPAAGNPATACENPQVSITKTVSPLDKSTPVTPSNAHVCPATHVRPTDTCSGPTICKPPMSMSNSFVWLQE